MSREVGQITGLQALLGAAIAAVVVAVLVAGLEALLPPIERLEQIAAPAPAPLACPAPQDLLTAATPSSAELIECAAAYDGSPVVFEGEVVRAVLRRRDGAWVQVNDDTYALGRPVPEARTSDGGNAGIAVWLPGDLADRISRVGGPRDRGDRIRVQGVFVRSHPRDAGNPALHADTMAVVEPGHPIERPVSPRRLGVAAVLVALAALSTRAARRGGP
jgi:hypothetical protein